MSIGMYVWFLLILGGSPSPNGNNEPSRDIVMFDPEEEDYKSVGQLRLGRMDHAVSLVPEKMAEFCQPQD